MGNWVICIYFSLTMYRNYSPKKANQIINSYKWGLKRGYRYLNQCYKSNSSAKDRAFIYCENLKQKYNGFNSCIISYNLMIFTYGFISNQENGKYTLYYITPSTDYYIKDIEKELLI